MAQGDVSKPNVVLIIADDLGWSGLGSYGSDLHETPNLDRFAAEGMKFTSFYAASPVCSPTRASILTGKYPARLHMTTHFENTGDYWRNYGVEHIDSTHLLQQPVTVGNLPQREWTLAEALRDDGYFTAHVGKWHLGNVEHYPENHGFDLNIGGTQWGSPDTYWYPWTGNKTWMHIRYIPGIVYGAGKGSYLPDRLTDMALEVIEDRGDQPFFLHLAYHTPHTPMEGKPELVKYFKEKVKPGMKDTNPDFAAMVYSLDENVGRVLNKLNEEGISEETIVIFLSDNGGRTEDFRDWGPITNNAPLKAGKGSLYEGGLRVPCIIKWPGKTKPHASSDFPLVTIDILPTVLDMVGLKKPRPLVDGFSFAHMLSHKGDEVAREAIFWHYPHYYPGTTPVNAVRMGDWKFIHYFDTDSIELYDLSKDLGEVNNVAGENPLVAKQLFASLSLWRADIRAQMPTRNKYFRE